MGVGLDESDFALRKEESLHSLYFWEDHAFLYVVSDVAHAFAVFHMLSSEIAPAQKMRYLGQHGIWNGRTREMSKRA